MRRAKMLLLLACVLALPAHAHREALAPGEDAPYLMGFDVFNGERQVMAWADNKLTLVNFWATWCEPCRKEMPQIQKLHERFEQAGLKVVGVTEEDAPYGDLQQFVYSVGATFLTIRTPTRVADAWGGVSSLPATFLIGDDGRLVRRYVGFTDRQAEGMAQDVENLLQGKPMGPMILTDDREETDQETPQQ